LKFGGRAQRRFDLFLSISVPKDSRTGIVALIPNALSIADDSSDCYSLARAADRWGSWPSEKSPRHAERSDISSIQEHPRTILSDGYGMAPAWKM
jgi:hypothetical protein